MVEIKIKRLVNAKGHLTVYLQLVLTFFHFLGVTTLAQKQLKIL
jgi:hypothetical protein